MYTHETATDKCAMAENVGIELNLRRECVWDCVMFVYLFK